MTNFVANLDESEIFGASSFVSPVVFSVVCLWLPFAVITTLDYSRRKTTFPITSRLSDFAILSNVFLALWALLANGLPLVNHFLGEPQPCQVHRILSLINTNVFQLTGIFIFALRCFRLYFAFELTSIRSQVQSHIDFALNERLTWFVQRRHWISMQNLTRVLWVAIGLHSSMTVVEVLLLDSTRCGNPALVGLEGNESQRAWNPEVALLISAALSFGYAIIAVPIAYQYRQFDRDVFRLRDEVSRTGWVAGACVTLFLGFEYIPGLHDVTKESFPVHRLILLVGVIAVHYYQIVVPLQLAVATEHERATLGPAGTTGLSGGGGPHSRVMHPATRSTDLQAILADKRMYAAFSAYLKKELSVENLIFWKEIESYRAMALQPNVSVSRVFARAEVIVDRFLTPKTLLEVNVCRETRFEPRERLFQIERVKGKAADADVCSQLATLFDDAQREVLSLMARDPLPRFMSTPEFAKLNDHGRTIEAWVSRTIEPRGAEPLELDRAASYSTHARLVPSGHTSPRSPAGSCEPTSPAETDRDQTTPSWTPRALVQDAPTDDDEAAADVVAAPDSGRSGDDSAGAAGAAAAGAAAAASVSDAPKTSATDQQGGGGDVHVEILPVSAETGAEPPAADAAS